MRERLDSEIKLVTETIDLISNKCDTTVESHIRSELVTKFDTVTESENEGIT